MIYPNIELIEFTSTSAPARIRYTCGHELQISRISNLTTGRAYTKCLQCHKLVKQANAVVEAQAKVDKIIPGIELLEYTKSLKPVKFRYVCGHEGSYSCLSALLKSYHTKCKVCR